MMAQSWAESTWQITNYGRFINQFPSNVIRSIRQFERINKKICRQKISIMFSQKCTNDEMLPNRFIGQVGRVFANGPGDLGSIPGQVITKTLKWNLIPPYLTLNNIRYVSRVKWSNPGKWVAPTPTPACISNWKGSLRVAHDYGHQLIYIYIYTWCFQ